MLDSLNDGISEGDAGAEAQDPANNGRAKESAAKSADSSGTPAAGEITPALDEIRRGSAGLASLLELDPDGIPVFVFRLTCTEVGRKALQHRRSNIEAVRAACADHIQNAIVQGTGGQAAIGGSLTNVFARGVAIARGHPDPGARVANVGDAVAALYEKAAVDPALRGLLDGRRILSVAEQVTAETQKVAAILGGAVREQIDEAKNTIMAEVIEPRRRVIKLVACLALVFAAAAVTVYLAGGLGELRLTVTSLGLPPG